VCVSLEIYLSLCFSAVSGLVRGSCALQEAGVLSPLLDASADVDGADAVVDVGEDGDKKKVGGPCLPYVSLSPFGLWWNEKGARTRHRGLI
jgi:hypothetical protein